MVKQESKGADALTAAATRCLAARGGVMSAPKIPEALSRGVFGWDPVRLADQYTANELSAAIVQLHADPANANPAHAAGTSINLYTKKTDQRTAALAWAIFYIKQSRSSAA